MASELLLNLNSEATIYALNQSLSKMGVSVVGLDLDDTLGVTHELYISGMNDACGLLAYGDEYEEMKRLDGQRVDAQIKNLRENFFDQVHDRLRPIYVANPALMMLSVDRTAKLLGRQENTIYYQMAMQRIQEIYSGVPKIFNGTLETIEALHRSCAEEVVLITHNQKDVADYKRVHMGLTGKFNKIILMDVTREKSDQYEEKLSENVINPSELLMIGDNPKADIDPVVALGGWAVWINDGSRVYHADHPKVVEVGHISQVIPALIQM